MHKEATAPGLTLEQLYTKQLPLLSQAVANARQAVEMGHKEHALAELTKVEGLLAIVKQTLGTHVKPTFVNATCPIMGGKIDPAKVTADLVREYQGQKVAFCCGMCPPKWDALTDAQKQAKLAKVKLAQPMQHSH